MSHYATRENLILPTKQNRSPLINSLHVLKRIECSPFSAAVIFIRVVSGTFGHLRTVSICNLNVFQNFRFDISDTVGSDSANEFKGDYNLSHWNCKVSVHIVKYSFLRSKYFGRILPMITVSFFVHDYTLPILNTITTLNIF